MWPSYGTTELYVCIASYKTNEERTLALPVDYMVFEIGMRSYGKIVIYQDNTSNIWVAASEGKFIKNRYVKIRRNFCESTDD